MERQHYESTKTHLLAVISKQRGNEQLYNMPIILKDAWLDLYCLYRSKPSFFCVIPSPTPTRGMYSVPFSEESTSHFLTGKSQSTTYLHAHTWLHLEWCGVLATLLPPSQSFLEDNTKPINFILNIHKTIYFFDKNNV